MTDKEIKQYISSMTRKRRMFTKLEREETDCYPIVRPYIDHFKVVIHTPMQIVHVPNHNKS